MSELVVEENNWNTLDWKLFSCWKISNSRRSPKLSIQNITYENGVTPDNDLCVYIYIAEFGIKITYLTVMSLAAMNQTTCPSILTKNE